MHLHSRRNLTLHGDEETVEEESDPISLVFPFIVFPPFVQTQDDFVAENAAEKNGKIADLHQVERD